MRTPSQTMSRFSPIAHSYGQPRDLTSNPPLPIAPPIAGNVDGSALASLSGEVEPTVGAAPAMPIRMAYRSNKSG